MELLSGLLLWTMDVIGVKKISEEKNTGRKVIKALAYLIGGFVAVVVVFSTLY